MAGRSGWSAPDAVLSGAGAMALDAAAGSKGRVLVVGRGPFAAQVLGRLASAGFQCAAADSGPELIALSADLRPEAVLFAEPREDALAAVRADAVLGQLPVLADASGASALALRQLPVDAWISAPEELAPRVEEALRARRRLAQEAVARLRTEMLLDITQAATSSLELERVLSIAVEKIARVVEGDRCSILLVEGSAPRLAHVVASRQEQALPFQVDLLRYPEIRRAWETRQGVYVEDVRADPLLEPMRNELTSLGVRSVWVWPLICHDEVLGVLYLRRSKGGEGFTRDEQEFARTAAAAIANSVRNAHLHAALVRKRENLESAYVDRYRELGDANRRLKELNRLKDEIIAVLSHDLRAPLNVLLGHARLLQDGPLDAGGKRSVEVILRQGKKILDFAESLLDKGRGEQARLSLEPRLVDISELCVESAAELHILAAERTVTLRSEAPESLMVVGDEVKLRQVLQNLIVNALHHARDAGTVVVRSQRLRRPDGEVARVMVQDDGQGIPADQLHLVFDRYRHGPGGVGLGLAICKEFVELHGGEVWAETPDGGGCAFICTLPLARESPLPVVALPEPEDLPRVLVVEDEPEVAANIAEVLRAHYRVDIARDGAEGLAKARTLRPDLVVMDVFLPKLDGLDAAVALKESSDTADIPVVLLSAHQGVADKVRALNLGAVDYLARPFQPLELVACAQRCIQLRNAKAELDRTHSLLRKNGHDPDTGLLNRDGLVRVLDLELARHRRYRRPVAVAVLRPREAAPDLAREAAALVRQQLRATDVVGHLGKGIFAVIMPETLSSSATPLLSRVVEALERQLSFRVTPTLVDGGGEPATAEALLRELMGPLA